MANGAGQKGRTPPKGRPTPTRRSAQPAAPSGRIVLQWVIVVAVIGVLIGAAFLVFKGGSPVPVHQ